MNHQFAMRCSISGRVQGVWFRASAKEVADKLGITGWARNLENGDVEVLACGTPEKLDSFHSWLQQGPPLAKVKSVLREEIPWETCEGFKTF